jgi:preprotein translocase subunit SecD
MKRSLLVLALLPLLAGCSSTSSVLYDVELNTTDEERGSMLLFASLRVIERRMAGIGEEIVDLDLKRNEGETQIYVETKNQTPLDILTDELTTPFDLQVMKESSIEEADAVVEGHGGFAKTGISHKQLKWLQASEEPGGKGRVSILFTQEGRDLMGEVFAENQDKFIGIFVRGNLISKLFVDTDELKDEIIITDIPTVQLANVFADDVNVGMHVTFTLAP